MNENEMIEEMASIICKETSNEGICEKCDFKKHEQFGYTYQCRKFDDAEALYNANCRIIADDEVVLTKGAYESISNKAKANVVKALEIKQETAKEILQMIYDKGKDTAMICLPTIAIKQLAKAYGIKLED